MHLLSFKTLLHLKVDFTFPAESFFSFLIFISFFGKRERGGGGERGGREMSDYLKNHCNTYCLMHKKKHHDILDVGD